jgi:ribosomal protein S18 acetylase RimI-like enzyme
MSETKFEINGAVTPEEIVAVREEKPGNEHVWRNCLKESLCIVTAREASSNRLLGIGFLVGNSRHGQLTDLTVHSSVRQEGIGARIVEELVAYAKQKGIRYFGLTYDTSKPWLKRFYEKYGFKVIDFAMWEKDSIKEVGGNTSSMASSD